MIDMIVDKKIVYKNKVVCSKSCLVVVVKGL